MHNLLDIFSHTFTQELLKSPSKVNLTSGIIKTYYSWILFALDELLAFENP